MNPNLEAFFRQFGRVEGLPDDFSPAEAWKYGLETPDGQFDYQKYQDMVKYGMNPSVTNTQGVSPGALKNPGEAYNPITNPYQPVGTVNDPNLPNWIRDQHIAQLRSMSADAMNPQNAGTTPAPATQAQQSRPQAQVQQPQTPAGGSRGPIPMSQFNLMHQILGGGFGNPYGGGFGGGFGGGSMFGGGGMGGFGGGFGQQMNPYGMGGMWGFGGMGMGNPYGMGGMQGMWPQSMGMQSGFGGMMRTPFAGGGGGYSGMPYYSHMQNPHPTWNPGFSWSQMPGLGYNFPMGYTPSYGFPRAHWGGGLQGMTAPTTGAAAGLSAPATPPGGSMTPDIAPDTGIS